jgi:hypothetical protein
VQLPLGNCGHFEQCDLESTETVTLGFTWSPECSRDRGLRCSLWQARAASRFPAQVAAKRPGPLLSPKGLHHPLHEQLAPR